jgi:nucleoside recognition membrane protein YjiH
MMRISSPGLTPKDEIAEIGTHCATAIDETRIPRKSGTTRRNTLRTGNQFTIDVKATPANIVKFAVFSTLGLFLFLFPIPQAGGGFNIPLGVAINWLETSVLNIGNVNLAVWLLVAICTASAIGSVIASIKAPQNENSSLAKAFKTTPIFMVSRVAAAIFAWMIVTGFGPQAIVSPFTGGVMFDVAAHLVAVFVLLGFAIPILTDFGIMEFAGVLVSKVVRRLFTLPGRASVDLMASWFGSSVASIILTRGQHEKRFYTGREAVVICTNFAFVSLPFTFVIANTIGIQAHFLPWYLIICAVCIVLAIITPRIWPLRGLADTYLDGSPAPEAQECVPAGVNPFRYGLKMAARRASRTSLTDVAKTGLRSYIDIYADLIPLILAWGVISLAIFEFTPVFQWISTPMGWYAGLLGVPNAGYYAPAMLIGFLDMFLPALLLSGPYTPLATQLVLGALAIVQIIYMTETGISILKSKMPIKFGILLAIFMIRTLIALPLIVLATAALTRLGAF